VANNKAGDNRWVMDSDSGKFFRLFCVWYCLVYFWVELCIIC